MTTAVEVAAGGKLYQLVVDTEQTGKALLKKGKLKSRVTIIPLNKIASKVIPDSKIEKARKVSSKVDPKSQVNRALDLVKYDKEVRRAMEYVFGSVLVCDSMKSARAVTFNKDIKLKTVTKEGDMLNPHGTISGGAKNDSRQVLATLRKLDNLIEERKMLTNSLKPLRKRLEMMRDASSAFRTLNEELELKTHNLSLVQKRCETSRFASLQSTMEKLDAQLDSIDKEIETAKSTMKEQDKLAKSLKKEIENFEEMRKANLKSKESEITSLKKELTKAEKACSKLDDTRLNLALELEQLQKDIENFTTQIEKSEENLQKIRDEVNELAAQVDKERDAYVKGCVFVVPHFLSYFSHLINTPSHKIPQIHHR